MKFEYTSEQLMVRDTVREFVEAEIRPRVKHYEAAGEFPADIVKKLGELGLAAMTLSEEYGGGGSDTVTYCLAIEELARLDASTAVTLSVNNSVCCAPIFAFGGEDVRARYLPRLARAEIIGGFALTEPGAGSDAANLRTRAVRDGSDYVLNGTKAWITNAGVGSVFVTFAKTDPDRGAKGITAFVVDAESPGFKVGKYEDKLGLRASATAQLIFEDCRVPKSHMLGAEGEGLSVALKTLDGARVGVAAQSVGIAQGALDEALAYARTREAFGKPISRHQAISFMLADMATEIDAARLLTHYAAWLKDADKPFKRAASEAKLYASEVANRVAYKAVQIHGGYGYSKDYAVERMFRDARVTTLYEGTSEIQRFVIARDLMS